MHNAASAASKSSQIRIQWTIKFGLSCWKSTLNSSRSKHYVWQTCPSQGYCDHICHILL